MITEMTPIIQKLREFVKDGKDGTFGTVLLAEIDTITRERDAAANLLAVIHGDGGHHTASVGFARSCVDAEAVVLQDSLDARDRIAELEARIDTRVVVTDEMVERASVALWHRYGDHGVEDGDIRAMLTAALTQEDA